ncbi:serine/threonine protein phosphatase [Rhizobium lentis]|uniref:metallophosphoesterase n=1 Tax=Rhizobium lentis TaxID=1138194 RepID=UPI001C832E1D|nr:metallophosphoesterase [Rhizobium lentis]MBX5132652.1 serine/threonine protein phosphatase [Rhizobium lentis]
MSKIHTFAIGDIHGRADLLRGLLDGILERSARIGYAYRIVFLGDIIDRGPDSREAMNLVLSTLKEIPDSRLVLGNHDSFVLRILDEQDLGRKQALLLHWITKMGGAATLASYGYDFSNADLDRILDVIDADHIAILRAAEKYVELDRHVLVHAGLEPGVPLSRQDPYKLMWIREPFLSFTGSFGKTVVHGHTPTLSMMVERFHRRISVDTGACERSILSAIQILPDGSEKILQSVAPARGVIKVIDGGILDLGSGRTASLGHAKNA